MARILYTKPKKKFQYGGVTQQEYTPDYTVSLGSQTNAMPSFTQTQLQNGDVSKTAKETEIPMEYKRVNIKGAKDYTRVGDLYSHPDYNPNRVTPIDTTSYTDDDYIRDANARLQKQYGTDWRYTRKGDKLYMEQLQPVG